MIPSLELISSPFRFCYIIWLVFVLLMLGSSKFGQIQHGKVPSRQIGPENERGNRKGEERDAG